jgi:hypothetical protein
MSAHDYGGICPTSLIGEVGVFVEYWLYAKPRPRLAL